MFKLLLSTLFAVSYLGAVSISQISTGQITSYSIYDDGYYKKGISRSFSRDNTNETVLDNVTGLVWQDDLNSTSLKLDWNSSVSYCENLFLAGSSDWRLPKAVELQTLSDESKSLFSIDDAFVNVSANNYWSSTPRAGKETSAYYVNFSNFAYTNRIYIGVQYNIRCVRGSNTIKTPTFYRYDLSEIVVDSTANITWQDDVNTTSLILDGNSSILYCENLNFANYSNWRLPTKNELLSLVDYNLISVFDYASGGSLINSIFRNSISDTYWSSTTRVAKITNPWMINFNGYTTDNDHITYVRCVRDNDSTEVVKFTPTITSLVSSETNTTVDKSISFTVTATDTNGSIVSYLWDFGDGTTSSLKNTTHSFSLAGTYNVHVTVVDNEDLNTSKIITIYVSDIIKTPPIISSITAPSIVTMGNSIPFSSSVTDLDGIIISYLWDFGDKAQSRLDSTSHIFNSIGTYDVSLTVVDNDELNTSAIKTITVLSRPFINSISASNTAINTGDVVTFDVNTTDYSDGTILSYLWNFGDGTTSTLEKPTHSFTSSGTYDVNCTVTDNRDLNASKVVKIIVSNKSYTLVVNGIDGDNNLTVSPLKDSYIYGEKVTLTVSSGFKVFDSWTGDINSSNNPLTITVSKNMYIEAKWKEQEEFFLNIEIVNSGCTDNSTKVLGTVSSNTSCSYGTINLSPLADKYKEGSTISINALPLTDYQFDGWIGDFNSTDSNITIIMNKDKVIKAIFSEICIEGTDCFKNGGKILNLDSGWNLSSLPLQSGNAKISTFKNNEYIKDIYTYSNVDKAWTWYKSGDASSSTIQSITLGKGFWVLTFAKTKVKFIENTTLKDDTINYAKGWNLLGTKTYSTINTKSIDECKDIDSVWR